MLMYLPPCCSASDWSPSMQLGSDSGSHTDAVAHRPGLSHLPHPHWPGQEPRTQPELTQPMESRQHVGPGQHRCVDSRHTLIAYVCVCVSLEWTKYNTALSYNCFDNLSVSSEFFFYKIQNLPSAWQLSQEIQKTLTNQ